MQILERCNKFTYYPLQKPPFFRLSLLFARLIFNMLYFPRSVQRTPSSSSSLCVTTCLSWQTGWWGSTRPTTVPSPWPSTLGSSARGSATGYGRCTTLSSTTRGGAEWSSEALVTTQHWAQRLNREVEWSSAALVLSWHSSLEKKKQAALIMYNLFNKKYCSLYICYLLLLL